MCLLRCRMVNLTKQKTWEKWTPILNKLFELTISSKSNMWLTIRGCLVDLFNKRFNSSSIVSNKISSSLVDGLIMRIIKLIRRNIDSKLPNNSSMETTIDETHKKKKYNDKKCIFLTFKPYKNRLVITKQKKLKKTVFYIFLETD